LREAGSKDVKAKRKLTERNRARREELRKAPFESGAFCFKSATAANRIREIVAAWAIKAQRAAPLQKTDGKEEGRAEAASTQITIQTATARAASKGGPYKGK
jgi:hypothetical protein